MDTQLAVMALAAPLVIVAVAAIAPRIGVAAPVLLVVVGIVVSYLPGTPELEVEPELVLVGILPPLLYSSAVNIPATDFRRNLKAITSLSVVLVIVSAVGSGLLLWWLFPDLSLAAAIALGAVISPPDAVAATAVGKRLGLPPRLTTVLEGEGLVNDATALVILRSALAAVAGAVSFWGVLGDFVYAVVVGALVGAVVGMVTLRVRGWLNQPVLNTAVSYVVPFLAYLPAERLEASGVLSVVVAGLVTGHGSAKYFTAQDRISERINWRTVQLLLENGVFLLMGYEITTVVGDVSDSGLSVVSSFGLGLLVTAALVVVRVFFVFWLMAGLRQDQKRAARSGARMDAFKERINQLETNTPARQRRVDSVWKRIRKVEADNEFLRREGLGWRGGAVLAWSGMRGVVTLAGAQSLPEDLPYRPQLILIAFTVAIVTLVGQGSTLPLLIRRLKITGPDAEADRQELSALMKEVTAVAGQALRSPDLRQENGEVFDPATLEGMRDAGSRMVAMLTEARDPDQTTEFRQRGELFRLLLEACQSALIDARASGVYSSRTLERAQNVLDREASRFSLVGPADEH